MFPSDKNNSQLSFQISFNQEDTIPQDLNRILGQSSAHSFDHPNNIANARQPNPRRRFSPKNIDDDDDDSNKRIMHRDVERRRRQEMATLYTCLRNLLPFEYVKGKRAISDHVDQAVKYIKHLQEKIEEFSLRRDEIKRSSNLKVVGPEITENKLNRSPSTNVVVRSSFVGVEVVINSGFGEQDLQLSKVLELLLEEGLNVVNCVSTNVQQRVIHTIQCEVSYLTCIDVYELQNKLIEAIPSSSA
ncbi:transcription factor bHLH36-like [Jatropha curcas]|uniref:transcription factor bHLH36-like n=1 Tax=Jatropha curcas TaxID=180498 RepID=UPI0005FAC2E7|nr:transcription factor bHLH36-like [Jatropha curcas]